MYAVRLFAVRRSRFFLRLYRLFEWIIVALDPLFRRIGYQRLEAPFAFLERHTELGLPHRPSLADACAAGPRRHRQDPHPGLEARLAGLEENLVVRRLSGSAPASGAAAECSWQGQRQEQRQSDQQSRYQDAKDNTVD